MNKGHPERTAVLNVANECDVEISGAVKNGENLKQNGYNEPMTALSQNEFSVRRVPITVEMYHVLDEQNAFAAEERLELIDGEIYEMSPIGSRHACAVSLLNEFFQRHCSDQFIVSIQNPIALDDKSEPVPDVCLLRRKSDYYRDQHPAPSDVHLLIEVSDTSAGFDRKKKAPRYAAAGIPEMWLIDLESEHIEVHSEPKETAYGTVKIYLRGEDVVSETIPEVSLPVSHLLG